MNIKTKLIITFLIVGLLPFTAIGLITLYKSSAAVEAQEFQKLTAVSEIKRSSIERYFNGIRDQVLTLSQDTMIIDAMQEFKSQFVAFREENNLTPAEIGTMKSELRTYYTSQFSPEFSKQNGGNKVDTATLFSGLDDDSIALQYHYIQANKNALGEKHKLDSASDASTYSKTHQKYHPAIRTFLEKFGYYDIFLVDSETGDIVYSVFKELDYSTSLINGPYAKTNFADAFRKANKLTKADEFAFVDFKQYLPSYNAPASFIAAPIFDGNKKLGVLMFQMPLDRITNVMSERAGLGKTGESYLVGTDHLMRSDSYLDTEFHSVVASFRNPAKGKVDTKSVAVALAGNKGTEIVTDYNGNSVLSAFTPVDILGVRWALIVDVDETEAMASRTALMKLMLTIGIIGAAAIAAIGYFVAHGFSNPIISMTNAMKQLSEGNDDIDIPAQGRHDEIGEMSGAVQIFKENALRNKELEAEQDKQKQRAEEEKHAMMNALADDFDTNIGGIVSTIASASTELSNTAQFMTDISEKTSNQANSVSGASEMASANVQTVAAATEELTASIAEINNQVSTAAEISREAVANVDETTRQMEELAQTADKVGEVISMISDIAAQTNLLALNATIEAARAGESGKGFAVVATEVKTLASETGKATEDISAHIQKIQAATQGAVGSISKIGDVVNQLEQTSASIAAAMGEQGTATREISRSVQEAAIGTKEVSESILGVTQASLEAGEASGQVTTSATDLSRQSEMMKTQVEKFLAQVRTA